LRRIVVSGVGARTCLGDARRTFDGFLEARTAMVASGSPLACTIPIEGFDLARHEPDPRRRNTMDRRSGLAMAAALEAWGDGVPSAPPERRGTCMASGGADLGIATPDEVTRALDRARAGPGAGDAEVYRAVLHLVPPLRWVSRMSSMTASHLTARFDLQGPSSSWPHDDAAGVQAVGEGARWIAWGEADVVLAGGADARLEPMALAALAQVPRLLSPDGARPFDARRDGTVVSEGAAVALLEERDAAVARGARVLAEVIGYAGATDLSPIATPEPGGQALAHAIAQALADAGIDARDLDGVVASGWGTIAHDRAEAAALISTVGRRVPVTATKGAIGHTMAAAGACAVVTAALALALGVLPPVAGLEHPAFELALVGPAPRPSAPRHLLVLGASLAGARAALILRRAA
jgi:3-oxoacyl-[acyl-carrier-protein] synthase II